MAAESEDSSTATTMTNATTLMMFVDEAYEFSAPKFYDFVKGESDEDSRNAELWFDVTAAYAPSRMSLFLLVDDSFYFFSSLFLFYS